MSTFAGLWVLLRWHGVFTLITCAGTRVVLAVQNLFALFTFDDFFCAHFREKNMTKTFNTSVGCGCSRHVPCGNGGCGFLVAKG